MIAIHSNNDVAIQKLLAAPDIDLSLKNSYDEAALIFSMWYESTDVSRVDAMVNAGADIHEMDYMGNSLLHFAAFMENYELAVYFLKKRVDKEIVNGYGEKAIDIAKMNENSDMIELLSGDTYFP